MKNWKLKNVRFGEFLTTTIGFDYSQGMKTYGFLSRDDYNQYKAADLDGYNKYQRFIAICSVEVTYEDDYTCVVEVPFYRSSGNNSGKTKGLWYPIMGIYHMAEEENFPLWVKVLINLTTNTLSENINNNTSFTHSMHEELDVHEGWLMKSPFFSFSKRDDSLALGYGSTENTVLQDLGIQIDSYFVRHMMDNRFKDEVFEYASNVEFQKEFNKIIYSADNDDHFKEFIFHTLNIAEGMVDEVVDRIEADRLKSEFKPIRQYWLTLLDEIEN